jgi:hypothetical protein
LRTSDSRGRRREMAVLVWLEPPKYAMRSCCSCGDLRDFFNPDGPVIEGFILYDSPEQAVADGWFLTGDRRWCPPDRPEAWLCPGCAAESPGMTLDEIRGLYDIQPKVLPLSVALYDHLVRAGWRDGQRLWRIAPGAPEPTGGWGRLAVRC